MIQVVMSLNEFNFSLVLKELWLGLGSVSAAMADEKKRDASSPLSAAPVDSAAAEAARMNSRHLM
jgi:hypothetical protein